MADIGTFNCISPRRAEKGIKVQRILNLFEISRPNKGLQRTNSLPNGKRPSLSSNDPDNWSARNSMRGSRGSTRKVPVTKEAEENGHTKKRTHHHHQIVEEHNEPQEDWQVDKKQITHDLQKLKQKIEHCFLADMEITIRPGDSDRVSDCERFSMETGFHSYKASEVNSRDYGPYSDFTGSRLHEERFGFSFEIDGTDTCSPPAEKPSTFPNLDQLDGNEDPQELETIEWWKHKSFVQINNENAEELEEPIQPPESPLQGRFRKNNQSVRNRRRTGILKKSMSVKELAQHFESFTEAAEQGETETYRKSVISEIDTELENMKLDGYEEGFDSMMDDLSLQDADNEELEKNESYQKNLVEDLFGEIYFAEDLENGFYYIEAYNDDGKELIICTVQIDRKTIDLHSFDRLKTKQDLSILSNDEKMMLVLGYPSGNDSKRSTIYSTTSGESCEDEDSPCWTKSFVPSAARRETFCDQQGIVRIERVAPYEENRAESPQYMNTTNNYYEPPNEELEAEEEEAEEHNYYESIRLEHEILFSVPNETKKNTLQYIIDEIKSTERKYVADMQRLLIEYKKFLDERCPEKVDVVFGNMEQIHVNQRKFLYALELPQIDIKGIAQTFLEFDDLFRLYPRYFRNTPKANAAVKELGFLIKEKQDRINDKLDLSAYLLTPIQRLGKYKLFLENIIKQLQKEDRPIGLVQLALDMIKKYMSKGNDAVALASILHSPLHTKDYGSFITREKFTMVKPKKGEVMVFLFEGVVIFTVEDPKNMEQFEYHQSIRTHDLRIATFDNDNTIQLTDFTKTKHRRSSKFTYVLDTKSAKLKESWKAQIEDILWKQMMKIKEITLKAYQNSKDTPVLVKKTPRKREQRAKSTGNKGILMMGSFPLVLYK